MPSQQSLGSKWQLVCYGTVKKPYGIDLPTAPGPKGGRFAGSHISIRSQVRSHVGDNRADQLYDPDNRCPLTLIVKLLLQGPENIFVHCVPKIKRVTELCLHMRIYD